MKFVFLKILLAIFLVGALFSGLLFGFKYMQERKLHDLESGIEALQSETVPLRFMVLSRDAESVSVRVRLYDLAGTEIGFMETNLPGRQVFFDFIAAPYKQIWLAFPYRIFTERVPPADGVDLSILVAPEGIPLTYRNGSLNADALKKLGELHASILRGDSPKGSFGNAVHDVAELGTFSLETVYKIVIRAKGGMEILEDEDGN